MQDFKKLRVWQQAVGLAVRCYSVTDGFPSRERYGMTRQMRRSAVSIASNIAEGCGRNTDGDLVRFLRIAYGSACELETQARVAMDVGIGDRSELGTVIGESDRIRKMLSKLIRRINDSSTSTAPVSRKP